MKLNLKIHDDTVDNLILDVLNMHIDITKKDIKRLKKIGSLRPHEQSDLDNDKENLTALNKVYDYFGGGFRGKR